MRGILALLLTAFFAGSSFAAESSDGGLEFNVICIDGDLPEGVRYLPTPRDPAVEINFAEERRSGPYRYRGPRELYFFREIPDGDGRPLRFSVATASLPFNVRKPLLIFAPGGNAARSEEYVVFVLDDSQEAFNRGTIRFFNLTQARLTGRIGEDERPLDSLRPTDIGFQAKRNVRTPFGLSIPQEEEPQVLLDSDLLLYPDRRYLMIILPPLRPDSLRYRLKLLQDIPPVAVDVGR